VLLNISVFKALSRFGDRKCIRPGKQIWHKQSPMVLYWKTDGDPDWNGVISGKLVSSLLFNGTNRLYRARGAGPSKCNQLEMVTTFTYKPSLVRIDASNFRGNRVWMKKHSERRKQCILAVVGGAKNFHPTADPLPGGAGPPKFKSAGDGHYLHPQTQFG